MTLASSVDTWRNMPIIKQSGTYSSSTYITSYCPDSIIMLKDGDALGTCKEYVDISPSHIEERDTFDSNSNLVQGISLDRADIRRQYWDYSGSPMKEYGWGGININNSSAIANTANLNEFLTNMSSYPYSSASDQNPKEVIGTRFGRTLYRQFLFINAGTQTVENERLLSSGILPANVNEFSVSDKSIIKGGSYYYPANSKYFMVYYSGRNVYFRQSYSSTVPWELYLWLEYTCI